MQMVFTAHKVLVALMLILLQQLQVAKYLGLVYKLPTQLILALGPTIKVCQAIDLTIIKNVCVIFIIWKIGNTFFSMIHPGGPSTFVPSTSPNNSAGPPGDMALTTGQGITPSLAQTGTVNGGFMRGSNFNTYNNAATFPFVAGTTYNGFWY